MAMKWLRKHNKKIMVVGGALLMLAFLMPRQGGCGRGPRMPDRAVAQAFGRKIMLSEYYGGQLEHRALRDVGLGIPVADPLDYVLLVREARQMHIPAGAEVAPEELSTAIAQGNKVNNLAELAAKLSGQQKSGGYQITEKLLRRAIGNFWAIVQAQQLVLGRPTEVDQGQGNRVRDFSSALGLAQPSEKELELMFRDVREMLDVDYVALPAWHYASKTQAASEAEIVKQFEAYKDQYAGTADNEFGYGYKQPILIQIEYIKADVEEIMDGLEEPAPAVLAEYYEKNKEAYALPTQDEAEEQSELAPDEDQNTEPVVKQYKPFEDIYEELKSNWLKEKARSTALSMVATARSLSRQRWDELEKEEKDTALDLAELYPYAGDQEKSLTRELEDEFKVVPDYKRTGWLDPTQAERLPGIGRSYTTGPQAVGFMALAFSARQNSPYQENQAGNRSGFEVGQDSPINLLDAKGNAYLFRVIGLETEKILSVEEMLDNEKVRSRVAVDIARRQAYEYAKRKSQELLELAKRKGIKGGLDELGEKGLEVRQTGMVARDNIKRSLLSVQLPLVDAQGRNKGEIELRWQDISQFVGSPTPVGMLQVNVINNSEAGRITAVGLNLPQELRIVCQQIGNPSSQVGASNGGEAVPAGTQGYTMRYSGRGIEAGPAGKFDLLVSADGQELVNTTNLAKGGVEPGDSQTFAFLLTHASSRLSTLNFVRNRNFDATELGGEDFNLVARLETSGRGELLRGVFPANRQANFLQPCFAVLGRSGLIHQSSSATIPTKETEEGGTNPEDELDEATVRNPQLLIDSQTQQGPCVLIELPREGMCYVGQVQKHLPLSREEFKQNRLAALNALMSEQYSSLQRQWWDSSNIRERAGYKLLDIDQDKNSEKEEQQDDKSDSTPDE